METVAPELPLPRLIWTSSGEADEEPFPMLTITSGVADPPEALAPEALPRLMTSSGAPRGTEPVAVVPVAGGWSRGGSGTGGCVAETPPVLAGGAMKLMTISRAPGL